MDESAEGSGPGIILLAEDNEAVRALLSTQLEKFGYHVVEAKDGADALRQYSAYASDIEVAVLDFRMPNRDGFEVLREIRERNPDLPVIFMTGDPGELPKVVLSDYGDIPIVSKPFSAAALHEQIQNLRGA